MTSLHLRLGKKGGSRPARPFARGSGRCSCWLRPHRHTAAPGTKSGGRLGRAPRSTGLHLRSVARRGLGGSQRPAAWPVPPARKPTAGYQYLQGKAPPCRAAPTAPRWAAASYCDLFPGQRPAHQIPRTRASSPPEPGLRPRRCHGASFFQAPSHGPRQETTAASPELTQSANALRDPSFPPPSSNRWVATLPRNAARGPGPGAPTAELAALARHAPAHYPPLRAQPTPLAARPQDARAPALPLLGSGLPRSAPLQEQTS